MDRKPLRLRDGRLDWRDPDMPVCASKTGREIPYEKVQIYARHKMLEWSPRSHYWRNDPTYNLRRKKR